MTGRRKIGITAEARRVFLESVSAGWSAERAAEVAGVSNQRFYERRLQDPDFAKAWQDAYDAATDSLRDELRRRSLEGWIEETTDGDGRVIRRVERLNAADLHLELKRRDPDYREGANIAIGADSGGPDPDVAAAIDRFTSEVVRLAERQQLLALSAGEGAAVVEGDWRPLPDNGNAGGEHEQ